MADTKINSINEFHFHEHKLILSFHFRLKALLRVYKKSCKLISDDSLVRINGFLIKINLLRDTRLLL